MHKSQLTEYYKKNSCCFFNPQTWPVCPVSTLAILTHPHPSSCCSPSESVTTIKEGSFPTPELYCLGIEASNVCAHCCPRPDRLTQAFSTHFGDAWKFPAIACASLTCSTLILLPVTEGGHCSSHLEREKWNLLPGCSSSMQFV